MGEWLRSRNVRDRIILGTKVCTANQVALAWLLHQPFPAFLVVGNRSPDHVRESMDALQVRLDAQECRRARLQWIRKSSCSGPGEPQQVSRQRSGETSNVSMVDESIGARSGGWRSCPRSMWRRNWTNSRMRWRVSSTSILKTDWTWEEWQASRARRRAVAARIGPPVVRRKGSSSDSRLSKAFDGERGPRFGHPVELSPKR